MRRNIARHFLCKFIFAATKNLHISDISSEIRKNLKPIHLTINCDSYVVKARQQLELRHRPLWHEVQVHITLGCFGDWTLKLYFVLACIQFMYLTYVKFHSNSKRKCGISSLHCIKHFMWTIQRPTDWLPNSLS